MQLEVEEALGRLAGFIGRAVNVPGDLDALEDLTRVKYALEALEEKLQTFHGALEVIATTTYPARYLGTDLRGIKLYGGTDDASRFAREVLASKDEA